jgi:hypothetical protein
MTKLSILAATILTTGIAANSLAAHAAPDFKTYLSSPSHTAPGTSAVAMQIPANIADPAGGAYTKNDITITLSTGGPQFIAKQDVAEFTNVFPPSFMTAAATGHATATPWMTVADPTNNPLTIDSNEFSASLSAKELAMIDSQQPKPHIASMTVRPAMHVKLSNSGVCGALDTKLDKEHLPFKQELKILSRHDCLVKAI